MDSQQDLFVVKESQPAAAGPVALAPVPDTSDLPLRDWIRAHHYQYILCEVVLREKTIEANALLSGGPEVELEYLLAAYEGDETRLREDIACIATFLHGRNMQPRVGVMTKESSISSRGELQLES